VTEGRYLALDIGEARIGVAVSDPLGIIASPHSVVERKPGSKGTAAAIRQVKELVETLEAGTVVVGRPLRTDGKPSVQQARVEEFAALLSKAVEAEIVFVDERFSTRQATNALLEGDVSRSGRKQTVDKVAAAIVLQQYLDMKRQTTGQEGEDA
jgi:putative Holliday junction resolvase